MACDGSKCKAILRYKIQRYVERRRHRQTETERDIDRNRHGQKEKSSQGQNPLAKHAWNSASLKPKWHDPCWFGQESFGALLTAQFCLWLYLSEAVFRKQIYSCIHIRTHIMLEVVKPSLYLKRSKHQFVLHEITDLWNIWLKYIIHLLDNLLKEYTFPKKSEINS